MEKDWKEFLNEGAVASISGRRENHSGLSLDHVFYTNFSHLSTVICNSGMYDELGFDSHDQAEKDLAMINDLRNDVAHRKLILESDDINQGSSTRDITDIRKVYNLLMRSIWELNNKSTSTVLHRSQQSVNKIEEMYADICQVCGEQDWSTESGNTTEAGHILPITEGGTQSQDNILFLCPNHHQFDRGVLQIDPDSLVVEVASNTDYIGNSLILKDGHSPNSKYLRRHKQLVED